MAAGAKKHLFPDALQTCTTAAVLTSLIPIRFPVSCSQRPWGDANNQNNSVRNRDCIKGNTPVLPSKTQSNLSSFRLWHIPVYPSCFLSDCTSQSKHKTTSEESEDLSCWSIQPAIPGLGLGIGSGLELGNRKPQTSKKTSAHGNTQRENCAFIENKRQTIPKENQSLLPILQI